MQQTLQAILSQPTAPFRETWVKTAIIEWCEKNRLNFCEDAFGNLWVGCTNLNQANNSRLVMVAHMDHPGFIISRFKKVGRKILADAKWLGGGPADVTGFPVQIFSKAEYGLILEGKVISQISGPRGPDTAVIEIKADLNPKEFEKFGPFGACLWYKGSGVHHGVKIDKKGLLYSKAADDLVGVCAMLEAIKNTPKTKRKGSVLLITRAEESGFHGAIDVLQKKILNPAKTLMISIETSSRLPGALPGLGPVIRLGDRSSVFHGGFVRWIEKRAAEVKERDKNFIYQKKLMDGGSCEATAFNCFGFTVAGISTPLENYHNQYLPVSLLNGKSIISKQVMRAPHPEIVRLSDVENLALLVEKIIREVSAKTMTEVKFKSFENLKKSIIQNYKKETKLYA